MKEINENKKHKNKEKSDVGKLFYNNKTSILYFELVYILIGIFVVNPLIIIGYQLSIRLAGFQIITISNLLLYIIKPFTIIILLIMAMFWTFYVLFQVSGLVLLFDKRCSGISGYNLFYNAFKKTLKYFENKSIAFFMVLSLIIPIFCLSIYGNNIINIIAIIIDIIPSNPLINIIIGITIFLICFQVLRLLFVFHYKGLEDSTNKDALNMSKELVKKNFYEILVRLLKLNLIITIIYFLSIILTEIILVGIIKLFVNQETSLTVFLSFMYGLNLVFKYVFISIFFVCNMALISSLFNKYNNSEKNVELKEVKFSSFTHSITKKIILIISTTFLVVISSLFFTLVNKGAINLTGIYNIIEVTAHRGSSNEAPENTLSAFSLAMEQQSDSIELDIQMTKDGEIVVFHDETLSRIASSSRKISDLTLDEVKEYDVGSHFSLAFKNERIPTLKEVLELVDGNVKLNIEIKVYNTNTTYLNTFAEKINEIITEYDSFYWCYFSSFNGRILTILNEINSKHTIGLITATGLSTYKNIGYDFISINTTVVTYDLVKAIHKAGLEVHVWTVDNSSRMIELINLGVDNIITNEPITAKNVIYAKKSDFIIQQTFSWFFDQSESIYELITQ